MGCIPARYGNGNSHDGSCSQLSLFHQCVPSGKGTVEMVKDLKRAFIFYSDTDKVIKRLAIYKYIIYHKYIVKNYPSHLSKFIFSN